MFGPEALKQGGLLIAPLLLLSIGVLAIGIDRLTYWIRWRRDAKVKHRALMSSLEGLDPEETRIVVERTLRRLERQFARWEATLDLAMVLGPLLGLLSTVIGLSKLIQTLGPELLLTNAGDPMQDYGRMLVGTTIGLTVAATAVIVQRVNRMQRHAVIAGLREHFQER